MSANLNVILSGATVQVVNTLDSSTRVNASAGNPTLGATVATYYDFMPIASGGGTVITLPNTTVYVVYVRNLGGQNSSPSGNISVEFQVTGGSLVAAPNCPIVQPGGVFAYWETQETAGGVIALTLIASVNLTPVELLLAY